MPAIRAVENEQPPGDPNDDVTCRRLTTTRYLSGGSEGIDRASTEVCRPSNFIDADPVFDDEFDATVFEVANDL
jgi:hypothetical protein